MRLALLLLPACLALAATAEPAQDVRPPAPLFASDRRLDRPITLTRARIYLGELLEQLGPPPGPARRIDDTADPASGIELTVILKDRPLREVMRGLQELLDTRCVRWKPILDFHAQLTPAARARLESPEGLLLESAGQPARNTLLAAPDPKGVIGLARLADRPPHQVTAFRTRRHKRLVTEPGPGLPRERPTREVEHPSSPGRCVSRSSGRMCGHSPRHLVGRSSRSDVRAASRMDLRCGHVPERSRTEAAPRSYPFQRKTPVRTHSRKVLSTTFIRPCPPPPSFVRERRTKADMF